jgi:hypothetical protein
MATNRTHILGEKIPQLTYAQLDAMLIDCPDCTGERMFDDPADCPTCAGSREVIA